jgi:hypothetical protein
MGGMPYPGMSDIIGWEGMGGENYFAMIHTAGVQTEPTMGEEIMFIMELDANKATEPRVYINNGVQIGTVPHGYIGAGNDSYDASTYDQEVLPSGSPPTTFFEVLEMAWPDTVNGNTWTWAGLRYAQPSDVAGNVLGQIAFWGLLEGMNGGDNDGPWTEVGTAAFGSPINYAQVMDRYYSAVPYFKGGGTPATSVRSLVYSEPYIPWPPPPAPEVVNLQVNPNPHNGNTISEYVTISATIYDPYSIGMYLSGEYRVDGSPWISFPQHGYGAIEVLTVFFFPDAYSLGAHTVEVRGFDSMGFGYGQIESVQFSITDTTPPLAAWNSVPGPTAYGDFAMTFTVNYEDFTDFQAALGSSYLWYSLNGGPQQHLAWNPTFDGYGSYLYSLTVILPGGSFLPGDIITYGGQVTDTAATPNTAQLAAGSTTIVPTPPPFDIPVIMGWNLISFPVDAAGSPETVLADAGGDTLWDVVKSYDGLTKTWKSYRIGSSANTLSHVDCTMGLWVHVTTLGDGYLEIIGNAPSNTQIYLYSGWNLVGYPSLTQKTVSSALWGTGADRVEVFDPAPPYIVPVGPDYVLGPGQGFWVRVGSDTVWTVDW